MSQEPFLAGTVTSINGSKIEGLLVKTEPGSDDMSKLTEAVQLGALVKIPTPRSAAYGMVSGLSAISGSNGAGLDGRGKVEIDLFGEIIVTERDGNGNASFKRGVSINPGLGQGIFATTLNELSQIFARPEVPSVRIGSVHQNDELTAHLMVDELLGKHFAILGTTGAGKSCALAVVLRKILESHPHGHVVLLDPHNEYARAFGDKAELINPDNLELPYWLLNFEELVEVLCSPDETSRESESFVLKDAVVKAKRDAMRDEAEAAKLTVDTPVPYHISAVLKNLESAMGVLEKAEANTPYLRLRSRIEDLRADKRYAFMFAGFSVRDTLPEVLARILRVPGEGRPLTIFDLSGVPSEIVDVVVSLLCRVIFDFALWSERDQTVPTLLVCEEAHRYIPKDEDQGFGPTRKAIARIAKEGRKYGVSLGLVTQRPSELSETILSQCSTLFSLRMGNNKDQEFVRSALPEAATGMLRALPSLRNQEALVVGEGVSLPMRVKFDDLDVFERPHSDNMPFSTAWQNDQYKPDFIPAAIERWRKQQR